MDRRPPLPELSALASVVQLLHQAGDETVQSIQGSSLRQKAKEKGLSTVLSNMNTLTSKLGILEAKLTPRKGAGAQRQPRRGLPPFQCPFAIMPAFQVMIQAWQQ